MTKDLIRGSAMNLAGTALGLLVSLCGYPLLVRCLGTERFGVTSIAGAVVGYFMVFDLGLARASVVVLGSALETRDDRRISGLFWSGQGLMFLFGSLGALAMIGSTPYLCRHLLHIPPPLMSESIWGLALVSLSVPVMITYSAQISFLGCLGRFGALNAIRTLMSVLSWVAPLVALHFRNDLVASFGAMLASRVVVSAVALLTCLRLEPSLRRPTLASWREISPMVRQGGWMSLLNLVAPLMSYVDRALVGAWSNLTQVTYYSVAGDTVQKLLIFQSSITGALFQILPGILVTDRERAMEQCRSALRMLSLAMVPCTLLASAFGHPVLVRWMGHGVGEQAYPAFRILLLGVFLNSFAYVPFNLIAAEGRSRFSALLNLAELPVFLGLLWLMVPAWAAMGAACAWTLRVAIDTGFHFYGGRSPFTRATRESWSADARWIAITVLVLGVSCFPMADGVRAGLALGWLALWSWSHRSALARQSELLRSRLRNKFAG